MRPLYSVVFSVGILTSLVINLAGAAELSKRFIFINNGYTPSMNHEIHDVNLQSFDRDLFGGRTTILNAAGPEATVVLTTRHGDPLVNPDRSFRMAPSVYPGRPSATLLNFRKELRAAVTDGAGSLTVVYGGHGGPRGYPFWGGEYITGKDLDAVYSEVPPTTLVRALHLHCYAGRAIVDSKRTVATDLARWGEYLDTYYPANRCALGLSNSDELGEYLGLGERWPETEWTRIFRSLPNPSLQDLQQRLTGLPTFSPLPKLTSDYLLDDVLSLVCRLKEPRNAGEILPGEAAICGNPEVQAFALAERAAYTADDLYFEYRVFKQSWAKDQIWDKDIELYISYFGSMRRADAIRESYEGRILTDAERVEMEARVRAELGDKQERWNRMFAEFAEGMHPDYRKYLATCDFKCIQEKAEDLPVMNANRDIVFPAGKRNLLDLEYRLHQHLRQAQQARKPLAEPMRAALGAFVETELARLDPRWEPAVSRFRALRACESAPIN